MYSPTKLAHEFRVDELRLRKILDIVGVPPAGLTGWTEEQYNEIKSLVEQYLHPGTNMVGADPEFEIFETDRAGVMHFRGADNYFRGGGQLGTDGSSTTGELRPPPGSPEKVLENVRNLLAQAKGRLPKNYVISAGAGQRVPLGGHIHISGRPCHTPLVEKLDVFLNQPLRAKSNVKIRDDYHYGRSTDVRTQPHGWEYRAPCSWLAHPDIAHGALAITWQLSQLSEADLRDVDTREKLFKAMGPRAHVARKFYETLEKIESLEKVNVFVAWGISSETLQAVQRAIARAFRFPVRFNSTSAQSVMTDMNLGSDVHQWTIDRLDNFIRRRELSFSPAVSWWVRRNVTRIPRTLHITSRDGLTSSQMAVSTELVRVLQNSRRGRGRSSYNVVRRILTTVFSADLSRIVSEYEAAQNEQRLSRLGVRLSQ